MEYSFRHGGGGGGGAANAFRLSRGLLRRTPSELQSLIQLNCTELQSSPFDIKYPIPFG